MVVNVVSRYLVPVGRRVAGVVDFDIEHIDFGRNKCIWNTWNERASDNIGSVGCRGNSSPELALCQDVGAVESVCSDLDCRLVNQFQIGDFRGQPNRELAVISVSSEGLTSEVIMSDNFDLISVCDLVTAFEIAVEGAVASYLSFRAQVFIIVSAEEIDVG